MERLCLIFCIFLTHCYASEEDETSSSKLNHTKDHGLHIAKFDFELVQTPYLIALWILAASVAKIGFHLAPSLNTIFPESCLLIFVGLIVGGVLAFVGENPMSLTPHTFFNFMLPPIILDAGYFMPNRLFFDNLGTILLFAVVGTLWSTFAVAGSLWGLSSWMGGFGGKELPILQCLLFSALISAVDPVAVLAVFEEIHVNELLYIVVFGESLLNDAVTVALYEVFEEYAIMGPDNVSAFEILKGFGKFPVVALGGTFIGIVAGLAIGFVTRLTTNTRVMEPLVIFVMAYLAYLSAEMFHLSGIMAATFCGLTMKNYVRANISQKSLTTLKYSMKMLSSGAETIIFIFLGVSTVNGDHVWNTTFVVATISFCTLYRAVGTFALSWIANHFRLEPIGGVDQFVVAYGGLRGAVAVALVLLIDKNATLFDEKLRSMMVTTTIAVIYFTVFVQGMTIKPIVEWLHVTKSEKRKPTMNERVHEKTMEHLMTGMESIAGHMGKYNLRAKLRAINDSYIKPYLQRCENGVDAKDTKILETYSKLMMEDMKTVTIMGPGGKQLRHQDSVMRAKKRLHIDDGIGTSDTNEDQAPDVVKMDELLEKGLQEKNAYRRCSYSRHSLQDTDAQAMLDLRLNLKSAPARKKGELAKMRQWKTVDVEDDGAHCSMLLQRRCSEGGQSSTTDLNKKTPKKEAGRPPRSAPPVGKSSVSQFKFDTASSIPEDDEENVFEDGPGAMKRSGSLGNIN